MPAPVEGRTHPDLSPVHADLAGLLLMVIRTDDVVLEDNLAMAAGGGRIWRRTTTAPRRGRSGTLKGDAVGLALLAEPVPIVGVGRPDGQHLHVGVEVTVAAHQLDGVERRAPRPLRSRT